MCLISPLLACQETRKNERKKERGAPAKLSLPTLSHFCCASSIYVLYVVAPWKNTPISLIHGPPFPECTRVSFDQVLPPRVEARFVFSGGRGSVPQAPSHSQPHPASLSFLHLCDPRVVPLFPRTPGDTNHNVIFTYILPLFPLMAFCCVSPPNERTSEDEDHLASGNIGKWKGGWKEWVVRVYG